MPDTVAQVSQGSVDLGRRALSEGKHGQQKQDKEDE